MFFKAIPSHVLASASVFAACLGLTVGLPSASALAQGTEQQASAPVTSAPRTTSTSGGIMGQLGRELSDLVMQNRDSVVMIRGHRSVVLPVSMPISPDKQPSGSPALSPPAPVLLPVIGSGFLVQGGIVVTTSEVVEDIINPMVILPNGRQLRVTALGLDKKSNLAILKVADAEALRALPFGDSDDVLPGMLAVTIGNQAGFPTSGGLAFIAQTKRWARSGERFYKNLIQFQGAVGPGCSGSPLLGPAGDVIGIVMAAPDTNGFPGGRGGWPGMGRNGSGPGGRKSGEERPGHDPAHADKSGHDKTLKTHKPLGMPETSSPSNEPMPPMRPGQNADGAGWNGLTLFANTFGGLSNIGFAIPVNDLKSHLEGLVKAAQPVAAPGWMGLRVEGGSKPGAYVRNLYEGSPADSSGLEIGDIITQIDGHAVHNEGDFFMLLIQGVENQNMRLLIQRGAATRTINVRLRARPDDETMHKMSLRVPPKVGMRLLLYFSTIA